MMIDNVVSWAVISFMGIFAALTFFVHCVNLQSKPAEPTIEKDEDLIFFD